MAQPTENGVSNYPPAPSVAGASKPPYRLASEWASLGPVVGSSYSGVKGYVDIPILTYVLAAGVVGAIPMFFLNSTGKQNWVWPYTFLITLSLAIYYWGSFERFAQFMKTGATTPEPSNTSRLPGGRSNGPPLQMK